MKTLNQMKTSYTSPTAEEYKAEADGVLCTSTSYLIINNGYITEDEEVWEK